MDKKILIVDDEPDILTLVVFRLKKAGFQVHTATDGKLGVEKVKEIIPDLILLDLRLPEMDGREVSLLLKSDARYKHIPIILSTASTENVEKIIQECRADDYMIKPFTPAELFDKISKYLVYTRG